MNQTIATLKLRGAALVVCGGVMACIIPACGGDDTAMPQDSGPDATPVGDDGGTDAKADVTTNTPDTGTSTDASVDHSVAETSTPDTSTSDVHADAGTDATMTTSDAGDAGHADATVDAAVEAEAAAPLAPLALCPVFDLNDEGDIENTAPLTGDPSADALTRASLWGAHIASAFAAALTNDCRTSGIQAVAFQTNGMVDSDKVTAYLDQVGLFTIGLMGCPDPDAGAPTYAGLIPTTSQGHVYSVADANILTDLYESAVLAGTSMDWADTFAINGMFPSTQPLTSDQFDSIRAAVEALQASYQGLNPSTTRQSSINVCADDAGAEGGTDGATSTGDAGSASDAAADATQD
ncbi:MAG TPA: hypothetical protein VGM06_13910 [Polyangiaceae bacterium]|jgi:hypothetical protein